MAAGDTDVDAFADDNIISYGDHWAIDWLQLGDKQGQLVNANYQINDQDTTLDSSGSGEWNGQFYLFGRRLAGSFGRREVSVQWPNTLVNASSLMVGSPVMTSSWSGKDFGTVSTSFSISNGANFSRFGGIMYIFLNTYARPAATSGSQIFGAVGQNVTFAENPLLRISGLTSSATALEIVNRLANSVSETEILGICGNSQCGLCDLFADLATIPPPVPTPTPDPETGETPEITRQNIVTNLVRANPDNCDCDGNVLTPAQISANNSNNTIKSSVGLGSCKKGCCCCAPESYFWESVGVCIDSGGQPKAKCENISYNKNGITYTDIPFFYFTSPSSGPSPTEKQYIVTNGTIVERELIKHKDKLDGFGVRAFLTKNSVKEVGYFTGGVTFT